MPPLGDKLLTSVLLPQGSQVHQQVSSGTEGNFCIKTQNKAPLAPCWVTTNLDPVQAHLASPGSPPRSPPPSQAEMQLTPSSPSEQVEEANCS